MDSFLNAEPMLGRAGYRPGTILTPESRFLKMFPERAKTEVKEMLKKAMEEAKAIDFTRSDEYTVAEWLKIRLEIYSKPHIPASTAGYYQGFLDLHVIPRTGDIKLNKLTSLDIQKLYNDLREKGSVRKEQKGKQQGLSSSFRATDIVSF